ncbi:MAG: hypothetical protein ABJD53_14010 [Gammaproteobacteria bacterium]
MTDREDADRAEILARLTTSRDEIRRVLDPPPHGEAGGSASAAHANGRGFPRSRTMQMLTSGRGLGTLGAVAAGLLLARPALALRLLRMLPASAVAKTLLLRAVGMLRSKRGGGD